MALKITNASFIARALALDQHKIPFVLIRSTLNTVIVCICFDWVLPVNQVLVFPTSSKIISTASMMVPKSGAAASPFIVNGTQHLWVTGGQSIEASISKSTEIYDFQKDEWQKGLDLPEPLIGHAATALDDKKVLISGGNFQTFSTF